MTDDLMPGFAALRSTGGTRVQTIHLVRRGENGGTPGPTLCGLTRFDRRDPETYALIEKADLPGWGVGGGVFGPGMTQVECPECWKRAGPSVPPDVWEGDTAATKENWND